MGRRKIEIKAIKDDRNRSVTFLKRKGGLFKKAHELSVLCSVDVAVIIFGSNKKLYEYSSCDISEVLQRYNYYGQPNEHKGPADFSGKKDEDDEDDEEIGTPPSHQSPEPPSMLPPQFQTQPHIRHQTPSASPPIGNSGTFNVQRQLTPQPQLGSRPSSRNAPRRTPSNLGQQSMTGPPPPHNYTYMQPPSLGYPTGGHGMLQGQIQSGPTQSTAIQHPHPQMQHMPMQAPLHHPIQGVPSNYQYSQLPPQQHPQPHSQMQGQYVDEQRRSMPPSFHPPERLIGSPQASQHFISAQPPQQRFSSPQPPQHQQTADPAPMRQDQSMPAPQQQPQHTLQPVKRTSKSRSIFTPIDESRSILSQHWASSTSSAPDVSGITNNDLNNRSSSIDVGSVARQSNTASAGTALRSQTLDKNYNLPGPPIPESIFTPPSRTTSAQMIAKRPRLKVQIPDEPSPSGSGTAGSSPPGSTATGTNGKGPNTETSSHSSGVVLPPPSPSTGVALSAGATGPPNPFARPHPPGAGTNINNRENNIKDNIETPASALPSRFMSNEFLPSPSSFFNMEWSVRGEGNTLPSPMTFETPVLGGFGNSFLRHDGGGQSAGGAGGAPAPTSTLPGNKRKSSEGEIEGGVEGHDTKRVKSEE